MEILRVPPYDDIIVNFVVPSGYSDADIYARVTDMADLSVQTLEFLESSTGDNINIELPGRYDNHYRVEIFTVDERRINSRRVL